MLEALSELAREAGTIAQESRRELKIELKEDNSIVTNGDKNVERFLRQELPFLAPGATFWGEEEGFEPPNEHGCWLVDPIDGTSNYAYGSPLWGVSIALYKDGALQNGAVYLPDLGDMFVGGNGLGATRNNEPMDKIKPGLISTQQLVSCHEWILRSMPRSSFPGKPRLSGAFVIDGTFTAMQRFRALLGSREKMYDVAACVIIARELEAEIRFMDGTAFDESELINNKPIGKLWGILPANCGLIMDSAAHKLITV